MNYRELSPQERPALCANCGHGLFIEPIAMALCVRNVPKDEVGIPMINGQTPQVNFWGVCDHHQPGFPEWVPTTQEIVDELEELLSVHSD